MRAVRHEAVSRIDDLIGRGDVAGAVDAATAALRLAPAATVDLVDDEAVHAIARAMNAESLARTAIGVALTAMLRAIRGLPAELIATQSLLLLRSADRAHCETILGDPTRLGRMVETLHRIRTGSTSDRDRGAVHEVRVHAVGH